MTVLSTVTRVRARGDGRLSAECRLCQITLEQLDEVDLERALAAFDACHPPGAPAHSRALPWGWAAPAAGTGRGRTSS
jgi:hypothetical protein